MAADNITLYKTANGSGEQEFIAVVGADNDTNTSKTRQPDIVRVRYKKDIADGLHADTLTALKAITIGDLVTAAFGADADIP